MFLKTPNLLLRAWKKEDIPSLIKYANNKKIWINLKDIFPYPYTEEEARKWIVISSQDPLQYNFVIVKDEEAISGIGLNRKTDVFQRTADIGYWVGEPFWGYGFATEVVKEVTKWGFETLDLYRIQAGVFEWNTASMRVLEKAGYHLEARLEKKYF